MGKDKKEPKAQEKVKAALRPGIVVKMDAFTIDSIKRAAERFGHLGITQSRARDLVEAEMISLCERISAVELVEEAFQRTMDEAAVEEARGEATSGTPVEFVDVAPDNL